MRLAGRSVLVTGASGGIGAATARVLVRRGARVVLHGRDHDRLARAGAGVAACVVDVDLTEPSAPAELVRRARREVGPIDAVVHCAGIGWRGEVAEMPEDRMAQLIQVDLLAPIRLTRLLLPSMIHSGCGHVAFVGSIAGLTGVAHEAVYAAVKAGLGTFADSLRMELAGTGVGVSTLNPGAVDTGFWLARGTAYHRRIPRPVDPGRIARLLVADIEHERFTRVVPRWLALAPATRALAPGAYRHLAGRFG